MPKGCYMFKVNTIDFDEIVLTSVVDVALAYVRELTELLLASMVDGALVHARGLIEPARWLSWFDSAFSTTNSR